jgi:hypothetical protein
MKALLVIVVLYVGSVQPEIESSEWPEGLSSCEARVKEIAPLYAAAEGDTGTNGQVIKKMFPACHAHQPGESLADVAAAIRLRFRL